MCQLHRSGSSWGLFKISAIQLNKELSDISWQQVWISCKVCAKSQQGQNSYKIKCSYTVEHYAICYREVTYSQSKRFPNSICVKRLYIRAEQIHYNLTQSKSRFALHIPGVLSLSYLLSTLWFMLKGYHYGFSLNNIIDNVKQRVGKTKAL